MKLKMAYLQIVGLKTSLMPTVRTLHHLGCIQIDHIAEASGLFARSLRLDGDTIRKQEEVAYLAARIEGLLSILRAHPAFPPEEQLSGQDCFAEARIGLDTLDPQLQSLVSRQEALEAEQASLPRYELTLRRLLPIVPQSARNAANVSIGVLVSQAHSAVLDLVTERVLNLTAGQADIVAENVDAATRAMLIVVPRQLASEVEALLSREDISRLRLPGGLGSQSPDAAVAALNQRLAAIPGELAALQAEMSKLASRWAPRLLFWRSCLRDQIEELTILNRFGETDQTFVLVGWVAERDVPRVSEALTREVGDGIVTQVRYLSPADPLNQQAPVILANPAPARPFETLIRLLALPRYEDIDPTVLMAIFLPIFFGMILGDVGYGTLLLLLSLFALKRFRPGGSVRDLLQILAMGAGWSIVFGFLYGEAFGTLGEELGMHPIWFDRASPEHVAALLIFTIAVGTVHVTLGLVLGVWEALRQRSRHLLLERGGMLVGLAGLFLIVSVAVKWLPAGLMTPGIAVLIVGIVLLGSSLGWLGVLMGPIEFIGLVGNILSYLRIAAIGLASVYLARVANELAGSIGNILLGVIVAVLIHSLNLALGAFSPTIHSLRLHYVEFFRKFYEGGGREFEPFQSQLLQGEPHGK